MTEIEIPRFVPFRWWKGHRKRMDTTIMCTLGDLVIGDIVVAKIDKKDFRLITLSFSSGKTQFVRRFLCDRQVFDSTRHGLYMLPKTIKCRPVLLRFRYDGKFYKRPTKRGKPAKRRTAKRRR
jgi:hypothetical protein